MRGKLRKDLKILNRQKLATFLNQKPFKSRPYQNETELLHSTLTLKSFR